MYSNGGFGDFHELPKIGWETEILREMNNPNSEPVHNFLEQNRNHSNQRRKTAQSTTQNCSTQLCEQQHCISSQTPQQHTPNVFMNWINNM